MGKIFINKNGKTHVHTLSTEKKSSTTADYDYRLSFLQGDKIVFVENFQDINYGDYMFSACNVEVIKGTLNVQNTADYMFSGNVIRYGAMDLPMTRIKEVDIKCTTTSAKYMFSYNRNLETVKLELPNVISCENIFYQCPNLRQVEIQAPNVTRLDSAFYKCTSLEHIDVSGFTKCKVFEGVFEGCKNLKSVVLPTLDHSVKAKMFKDCTSLESVELNFIIDNSIASDTGLTWSSFDNCVSLHTISGDWSGVRHFGYTTGTQGLSPEAVFEDCCSLQNFTADVSDLNIGDDMFYNCVSLENFTSSLASLTTGVNMFLRCKLNLQSVTNIINSLMTENTSPEGVLTLGVDKNIKTDVTSFFENIGRPLEEFIDGTIHNISTTITNAAGNTWIIYINWN